MEEKGGAGLRKTRRRLGSGGVKGDAVQGVDGNRNGKKL